MRDYNTGTWLKLGGDTDILSLISVGGDESGFQTNA